MTVRGAADVAKLLVVVGMTTVCSLPAWAQQATDDGASAQPQSKQAAPEAQKQATPAAQKKDAAADKVAAAKRPRFEIDEYRIEGSAKLTQIDVEEAVYPFLGPGRTEDDVEKARAALEKAYSSKGYQTVSVSVPQQNVQGGVVVLRVAEMKVGRLRVKNSHYFDLEKIKQTAPSVAEGQVPNFNDVTKDIVALNQWPDRKVTPTLRAGVTPGTVDVDLNVDDKVPMHGSVELNDRQSPNTTPLRVTSTVHYDNLWQRGDSLSVSYQVAPERRSDAEVFSTSYLARTHLDWLNVLVYGVNSNSDVATVGGQNVIGPGYVIGSRAVITLPGRDSFFHSISVGADYKYFAELLQQGGVTAFSTPVGYVPAIANYSATWQHEGGQTVLNAGLTAGLRGIGSDPFAFDEKRYKATENFFYFRGDVSDTEDFKGGPQLFMKVQGQVADQPLVSSEEFTAGGFDSVRGYLESETLGDTGVAGTLELRTPNIPDWLATVLKDATGEPVKASAINEFRLFAFTDAGVVIALDPLPAQQSTFYLASYGFGAKLKMLDHVNGMVAFAMPVVTETYTTANKPRVLFRVSGEF